MNKSCVIYFHQGWTDIINCLSLINYHTNLYSKIYLIIRKDSKQLIDFYTKNINEITIFYIDKIILDHQNIKEYLNNNYKNFDLKNIDFLGFGFHDIYRNDIYKNVFDNGGFFVEKFYNNYKIPYNTRINCFDFKRNFELEEIKYNEFIKIYGKEYILYHEVIENYNKNIKIINLNGISDVFFDMIKVLENAIEIHLLDSVWGALIYQLDAKYKLFQSKKIFLYAKRGYHQMFLSPVKLDNWIII